MNKKPWEEYPEIWKTKYEFFNFIRGGIRRGLWKRHPVKISLLRNNRFRGESPSRRNKNKLVKIWMLTCSVCKKDYPQSQVDVDHIKGNNSLKDNADLQGFIEAMIFVTEEDLAIVCKECHAIKTYSERMGVSHKEAEIIKKAIKACKQKITAQKKELLSYGFSEEEISNPVKRRECYIKHYEEN